MLAVIQSAIPHGTDANHAQIEVHVALGLPGLTIIGRPDGACREARDRIRSAILATPGLTWPQKRITVNIVPSSTAMWSGFDLAIAIGILCADEQLALTDEVRYGHFVGELSLDGTIRDVRGIVPIAEVTMDPMLGAHGILYCSQRNAVEAMALGDDLWPVGHANLDGLLEDIRTAAKGERTTHAAEPGAADDLPIADSHVPLIEDLAIPARQKYALAIAMAGGHHTLIQGAVGSGRTLVARAAAGLLPSLNGDDRFALARIRSAAGLSGRVERPPLRTPHYTSSNLAILGGGSSLMVPGEVTLAHHGVLVLEDMPEFTPSALDAIAGVIAEGHVSLARGTARAIMPADFILVATAAWCSGGCDKDHCTCSHEARQRFARRFPGNLYGRLSIRIDLTGRYGQPVSDERGATTAQLRERVSAARITASHRNVRCNNDLDANGLACIELEPAASDLVDEAARIYGARHANDAIRIARTIADFEGCDFDSTLIANHIERAALLTGRPAIVQEDADAL